MIVANNCGWIEYRMSENDTKSIREVTMVRKSCRLNAVNVRTCAIQKTTKIKNMMYELLTRNIMVLQAAVHCGLNVHPQ